MSKQTTLSPVLSKLVRDEWEILRRKQIEPWLFMEVGEGLHLTDFYGSEINYRGIRFGGSSRMVFWGHYIDPFLEDVALRLIGRTIALCKEEGHELRVELPETGRLLKDLVRKACREMVSVDSRLGGGSHDVAIRGADKVISDLDVFIDARVAGLLAVPPRDLHPALRWIATQVYESETDFLAKAVPPLARALGWGDDQVFFQTRLPGHIPSYADAVLAPARTSTPRVLIEAGLHRYQPGLRLHERLRSRMAASRAEVGVFLCPEELVVVDSQGERGFSLADIGREEADQVQTLLGRSPGATAEPEHQPAPGSADATFDALLQAVDDAATNDEKKKSLERLAAVLLAGMPPWKCKYANLVTRSAEIDIVVEQVGSVPTALSEFGRYALVECKNWQKPVDAKHIRDFIGKMRNASVRLGIVFSMKGVTGEGQGTDALREVQQAYLKEHIAVVVISRDDFRACADPKRFLALVDERLDALRFDM